MDKGKTNYEFRTDNTGQMLLSDMLNSLQAKYPVIKGTIINFNDMVFEERVKMNCFYCGRYNDNWKCPPHLPDLDCRKMFSEYEHIAMIYLRIPFNESNYSEVRTASSVELHYALLDLEKYLWNRNNSTSVSFLGGSCKLCKNGCGKEKCNNPYQSRSPLEATGLNILKTASKYGIEITFPPKDFMLRVGLLLW